MRRTLEHGGLISHKYLPDGSRQPYEMNINYLDALSNPAAGEPVELAARRFLTAQAIMLSLRGVPGIYFHSLFGSRGDREAAETSGIPRRINREKLDRARLEGELTDERSLRNRVFDGCRELLRIRREHAAFAPTSPQRVLDLDPRAFTVLRETADGRDHVLCLHNISGEAVDCALPNLPGPARRWRDVLPDVAMAAPSPWGEGRDEGERRHSAECLWLEPWATRWLGTKLA